MLPIVDFCGLQFTKMLIGANPFGGFSHQSEEMDRIMREFHSADEICKTWDHAWKAGINTFVTNNETPHVINTTRQYLTAGGPMQWVAQVSFRSLESFEAAVDEVVAIGCKAMYLHGGLVDGIYDERDEAKLRHFVAYAQSKGIPVGVAAHNPDAHYWINRMDIVDFHVVPFFNCGSVHSALGGERFQLDDVFEATKLIRFLKKPCIAYKILGAGRLDPVMAFDYALRNIKPGDVINVGMNRQADDAMVEKNAELVTKLWKAE